ncbi:helix-turn-helix transcriptional regulator [Gemmatimonadota bacterium]
MQGDDSRETIVTDTLLTEVQAAEYLHLTPRFFQARRQKGNGPRYVRISSRCIRYRKADLDDFIENHLRFSTSDIPGS